MSDTEITGDENSSDDPRGEDTFLAKMRDEANRSREWSAAFAHDSSNSPELTQWSNVQQTQAKRITELQRSIVRLRRSVWISNLISGIVVVVLLSLAGYAYLQSASDWPFGGDGDANARRRGQAFDRNLVGPEFIFEADSEFKIRTNIDRKYQLILRELNRRSRGLSRPSGEIELRNAATELYVQIMADLFRVVEQAAQDQPSSEIMMALTNLAAVNQQRTTLMMGDDLDMETRNKLEQISTVLNASDVRPSRNER